MSDQQDNTMTWMDLAKHTTNTLGIEPEIAGAQVMEWVLFMHDREPDFNRMAIPHSYIDKFLDMAGMIYKARHTEPTERHNIPFMEEADHLIAMRADGNPTPSMYDPNSELDRVEVKIIAGGGDQVAYTNDSVKRFIEKRLLIAWTALKNADHLNDLAAPNLLTNQDPTDAAIDVIGKCTEEISTLNIATISGNTAII